MIVYPPCQRCSGNVFEVEYDGSVWCILCGTEQLRPGEKPEGPLPLVGAMRLQRTRLHR